MAMLPSVFVSKFLDVLVKYGEQEAIMLHGVPSEIKRLRRKLGLIRALLVDAERRQSQEEAIKYWLNELKDLMYDADDIIDEIKIENSKRLAAASSSSSSSSSGQLIRVNCCPSPISCIGFRHQIGNKIKNLNTRLDEIIKEKNDFNLTPITPDDQNRRPAPLTSRRITSSLVEPDLVGTRVEKDTRTLVRLLLEENHHHKMRVTLAIIGMGGIGKTTLAQKIFNDEMVQDHFHMVKPLWICVSQDVNETKILREIIKHVGGDPGENQDMANLEVKLHEVVRKKIIFLVMDDVWDASLWHNLLRKPLQSREYRSRIIITTRSMSVAKGFGAIHLHSVEKLSVEDCWLLLSNSVFWEDDDSDKKRELRDIGMKIVEKCDGLPLAINAVTGVLSTKDMRYSEWEKVLRNPFWSLNNIPEGVLGVLYLSYEDLPSYLKPCFLYLALYPEDCRVYKLEIEKLWCFESLVEPLPNLTMEETAEEYWKELIQRHLLQPDSRWYNQLVCTVHDLVRSLAQYLAHDESFCGDAEHFTDIMSSSSSSPMKPRRLFIQDEEVKYITNIIRQQTSLRALMIHSIQKLQYTDFISLKCLRILDLSFSPLEELPGSIANLVHLRFLSLSRTKLREIPECIGYLWHLNYLYLYQCENIFRLPARIVMLHNLKYLTLKNTPINGMPLGLRRLQRLTELWGFPAAMNGERVEKGGGSTLEDLGSLSKLTHLSINNLERVSSSGDARAASLKDKHHLRRLHLRCIPCNPEIEETCTDHAEVSIKKIEEVFEELCPPSSLEELEIKGYFGLVLPSWMRMLSMSPQFPALRMIVLKKCNHFVHLPPALGQLPLLDYFKISGASGVTSIGPELFFGMNDGGPQLSFPSFPKLDRFCLRKMPNWREWHWVGEGDQELRLPLPQLKPLPRLQHLGIKRCPKLRSLPTELINHAVMLQKVDIREANSLREIKNLLFIKKLTIAHCPMLEEVSNLPNLQHLELLDPDMESLPEWLLASSSNTTNTASTSAAAGGVLQQQQQLQFGALQKLYIEGSVDLLSRCLVDGPEWPKIRDIPQVKAKDYDDDGSAYFSYTKAPFTFDTNLKQ